jgi:hypothetical protein
MNLSFVELGQLFSEFWNVDAGVVAPVTDRVCLTVSQTLQWPLLVGQ